MRSEAEIRKQINVRFRRWAALAFNGGLWAAVAMGLYFYSERANFSPDLVAPVIAFMVIWAAVVGLHFLYSLYTETRESLVQKAIEREREFYLLRADYEKRKRDEALPELADDGELIDFADWQDEDAYAKRS